MTLWNRGGPVLLAVLALALCACGEPESEGRGRLEQSGPVDDEPEEEGSVSDEPSEPVEGQTGATEAGSQCAAVLGVTDQDELGEARQDYREMGLVEAMEQIDPVRHVASAFQTPDARAEFEDVDAMTVFAPVSPAFHERSVEQSSADDEDESADDDSYTRWPASTLLRAHSVTDESLAVGELVEQGEVTLADGTVMVVESDDGVARVTRDGITADVLCGDIEVDNGFIHVIGAVLFENEETDVEDDVPGSNQEVPFRVSDAPGTEPPGER